MARRVLRAVALAVAAWALMGALAAMDGAANASRCAAALEAMESARACAREEVTKTERADFERLGLLDHRPPSTASGSAGDTLGIVAGLRVG